MKNLKQTQNNFFAGCKTINPNTQRGRAIINSYVSATASHLREVYTTYSTAKAQGFIYCTDLFCALNGRGLRVISASTFAFSVAFMVNNEKDLLVITASNTYLIKGAFDK